MKSESMTERLLCIFGKCFQRSSGFVDKDERIAASLDFFASLRGRYSGHRGFIVGNGPSLGIEDLDLLVDEITIASNKIFLAFPKTRWRPTFYTIVDNLVWEKVQDQASLHDLTPILPDYLPVPRKYVTSTHTFHCLGNAADLSSKRNDLLFSDDFRVGAYGGYTVTYENLQLAAFLGLDPIYIIGCDHNYQGEKNTQKNKAITTTHAQNHFLPNYREPGELVNPAPITEMDLSYEIAMQYSRQSNVRIFNATRGGMLEVFPRISFDSLQFKNA